MKKFSVTISFVLPAIILLLMIGEVAVRYPCNHGGGFNGYSGISIIAVILTAINLMFHGLSRISIASLILAIVSLLFICVSDCFNLYVSYDVWTKRDMPAFGQFQINQNENLFKNRESSSHRGKMKVIEVSP